MNTNKLQMQAKTLQALKPLLNNTQGKLIDISALFAEHGDKWVKQENDAEQLLAEIKTIVNQDE